MRGRVKGRQDAARVVEELGIPVMLEAAIKMEAERRGADGDWARSVYSAALSLLVAEVERVLDEECSESCDPRSDERVLSRIRGLVSSIFERALRDLDGR